MKLIQETVDCIKNTFVQDTESDRLVRNCMALVQNAIDGEYHDMEEVEPKRPLGKWQPLLLKTLNGDDIVAYESSCCRAIADKKYQHCPNCLGKMDDMKEEANNE